MKNIIVIFSFVALLFGCKSSTVEATQTSTDIITANNWKIDRFATKADNKTLTISDLGAQPFALMILDFSFKSNNVVRAVDRTSGQIPNSGTWYLKNNDKTLDFDVSFFAGTFDVVELTKTKMVIRIQQPSALFPKIDSNVNWEFVPSL